MNEDLPTIGELNRNIVRLSGDLSMTRAELAKLNDLTVTAALNRTRIEGHDERLDELEDALRWVTRAVLGAVILAFLGLVLHPLTGG